MSKNKSDKKSDQKVNPLYVILLAFAEAIKFAEFTSLVQSALVMIIGIAERLAEESTEKEFVIPSRNEGEAELDFYTRVVSMKEDADKMAGNERMRVKTTLIEGSGAVVEELGLSGKGIDPTLRKRAEDSLKAGKPVAVIATETGISLPSLNNWKKALGLTKPRATAETAATTEKK